MRLGDIPKGGRFRTRLTAREGVVVGTDGIGIEVRWIEPDHDGTRRTQGVVDCPERWYRLHPQVEVDGEEGA